MFAMTSSENPKSRISIGSVARRVGWVIFSLLLPLIILTAWEFSFRAEILPTSQFASPKTIWIRLSELFEGGELQEHLGLSFGRLLIGSILGAGLGAVIGVSIAIGRITDRFFGPTLAFLAGVPVVIWMPAWIAFFGTGETFKIGLVAIAAFFLNFVVAIVATKRASKIYLEVANLFAVSGTSRIVNIYFPAVLEQLFISFRVSLAFGWIILFFVEYAVSETGSEGLGWFVNNAREVGRIEDEFSGLVVLGITAFCLDRLIAVIQRLLLDWSDTVEASN